MYTAYRVITYMEAYESIYYEELFSSDNRKQLHCIWFTKKLEIFLSTHVNGKCLNQRL